jgi:AIR carboxylase
VQPLVGIVMGSSSDHEVMKGAETILERFGVASETHVVSAHRTPEAMIEYGLAARGRGLKVLIAGAGGAAHLPGMLAAVTTLPVIGVPVALAQLDGLDSLLSIAAACRSPRPRSTARRTPVCSPRASCHSVTTRWPTPSRSTAASWARRRNNRTANCREVNHFLRIRHRSSERARPVSPPSVDS